MNPTHIILHCSATRDSGTVSWVAIRRYHKEVLRWRDIGYHFGIERIGDSVEVLLGRWWSGIGAHCSARDMNWKSLGICCVGDFDRVPPPQDVWYKCLELCEQLCHQFNIDAPNVRGHREFDARKTCPGLMWNMDAFRQQLNRELQCL